MSLSCRDDGHISSVELFNRGNVTYVIEPCQGFAACEDDEVDRRVLDVRQIGVEGRFPNRKDVKIAFLTEITVDESKFDSRRMRHESVWRREEGEVC